MDKEKKKRWVEALRSGGYRQGKSRLCKDDSYCCLGVACDLFVDDYWVESGLKAGEYYIGERTVTKYPFWRECMSSQMPRAKDLKAIGLTKEQAEDLASRNDAGDSFKEIADHIEKNL